MYMKHPFNSTSKATLSLILALTLPPVHLHAQLLDSQQTVPEPLAQLLAETVVIPSEAQGTIPADVLTGAGESLVTISETSSPQNTIPADTLVQTENPSQATSNATENTSTPLDTTIVPSGVPIVVTTPIDPPSVIPLTVPETNASTTADIIPLQTDVPEVDTQPIDPIFSLPEKDIPPKKEFTFSFGASAIPTKHTLGWQGARERKDKKGRPIAADTVSTVPSFSVDPVESVPVVSGRCSDTYYVILLYKNETDYDANPGSYILNRAFPCTNGSYSYAMKKIPESIPNGTYYLLVGSMGDVGSWTPITSLVPITVTHQ